MVVQLAQEVAAKEVLPRFLNMNKRLLLVFTKNPQLGKVKTRLAKTIGDEKALLIFQKLIILNLLKMEIHGTGKFLKKKFKAETALANE